MDTVVPDLWTSVLVYPSLDPYPVKCLKSRAWAARSVYPALWLGLWDVVLRQQLALALLQNPTSWVSNKISELISTLTARVFGGSISQPTSSCAGDDIASFILMCAW